MKKGLSILLSLVMVIGIIATIPFTASADTLQQDANGFYLIDSYAKLKEFAQIVNGGDTDVNAKLTANITADDTAWNPIGNDSKKYNGTFDGDGHVITGLTTPEDYDDFAGLFGYVGMDGVIQNVGLEDGTINGKAYVGGIAGENIGTVQNCYNKGMVKGNYHVGGIAGENIGTVQNCYNTVEINGSDYYVGGIVGSNYNGSVKNCFNTAEVKNYRYAGGIAGANTGNISGDASKITNCYNTGAVTATFAGAGGIVGYNFGTISGTASVSNCYNTGLVTGGNVAEVGGIIGYHEGYYGGTANVTNCYNTGLVTGGNGAKAGGIIGYHQGDDSGTANVTNCYFDRCIVTISGATDENNWKAIGKTEGDATETNIKGLTTAEMTGTNALTGMAFSDA
ncbi:MAG: hypothetical protein K5761_04615, partial [Clostridiales bacterium]|nr:hypothetical protein [Clostridiales bacterium]